MAPPMKPGASAKNNRPVRSAHCTNRYVRNLGDARNTSGSSPRGISGGWSEIFKTRRTRRRNASSIAVLPERTKLVANLGEQRDSLGPRVHRRGRSGGREGRPSIERRLSARAAHLLVQEVAHLGEALHAFDDELGARRARCR